MPKPKKVETIGSVELVNFPELGIRSIPAKIDTGADNSSIWASNISINSDVLNFTLFGPGSRFYTGDVIATSSYQTTSVKNSFGVTEFRYKVKLLAYIGNRRIRAWFTLSDRSDMTYPLLIGKKFLKDKYLVDVSKLRVHGGDRQVKSVLVIASKTDNLDGLFENIKSNMNTKNVKFVIRSYQQLAYSIGPRSVKVVETQKGKNIGEFDLVYFKSHRSYYPFAVSAAQYLRFNNVKFFDRELTTHIAYDKLSSSIRLGLYNLPIPRSVCGSTGYLIKEVDKLTGRIGWPLICKEINSDRGRKNYFVKDKKELLKILKDAAQSDIFILQSYVPNRGYLRLFVFGKQVSLGVFRKPIANVKSRKKHLNSPFGSANASMVEEAEIESGAKDLAVKAAELMNRQVAGVDLIKNSKSKKWYILEVNNAPQLKSGSFSVQKEQAMAEFIDNELNR